MKNWKKRLLDYLHLPIPGSLSGVDSAAAAAPLLREALTHRNHPLLATTPDLATAERLATEMAALNAELGCGLKIRHLPETVRGRLIVSGGESRRANILL